jgi:hypothetical protein
MACDMFLHIHICSCDGGVMSNGREIETVCFVLLQMEFSSTQHISAGDRLAYTQRLMELDVSNCKLQKECANTPIAHVLVCFVADPSVRLCSPPNAVVCCALLTECDTELISVQLRPLKLWLIINPLKATGNCIYQTLQQLIIVYFLCMCFVRFAK